ncbi:hypothetical protein QTA57_11695 [Fontisubflavum oceani]|uniref:hypothetical protein n=1 Tax=Fontisubflavum oceani TaxID=2978973 RepID=UPI0025B351C1|nr:hypothetical protein [Fontisubflavum oceani]WJY20511.1 hypothetical protein QTA57_11695 [Fontisubflavum oceani]
MSAITHETPASETERQAAARAERVVSQAMKAFEVTLEALEAAVDALRAEAATGEQAVSKDLKAMNAAFLFALQMEEKARAAGDKHGAGPGAGQLDLDAARAEIDLRLACLRAARSGGGVSGRAE